MIWYLVNDIFTLNLCREYTADPVNGFQAVVHKEAAVVKAVAPVAKAVVAAPAFAKVAAPFGYPAAHFGYPAYPAAIAKPAYPYYG